MVPLILSHDLQVDGQGVSDSVRSFAVQGKADEVTIPATAGNNIRSVAAGAEEWSITISYLQSESTDSLSDVLWDAFTTDADKIVSYSGKMRDASAYRYAGNFCVTDVMAGGEVNSLGENTVTFKCTGRPTRTSPGS